MNIWSSNGFAPVAQGIEQWLPKPRVGGSIPPRRIHYVIYLILCQDLFVGRIERSETRHGLIVSIMSPVNIIMALRSTRPTIVYHVGFRFALPDLQYKTEI